MEIQDLVNKWSNIPVDASGNFKSLRIDGLCIPDLFVSLNVEQRRCLILKLPSDYNPDFQSSIRQNLSLELYAKTRWIVLALLDDQYFDLFNDLILSIHNKIKDIDNPKTYVTELLKTYYKWSEFFLPDSGNKLSDDQVKGFFGELVILNRLVDASSSSNLNDLLNSWKGPYDTGHDFIFETVNIEVKTKNLSAANVKISSEHQLQAELNKDLELAIVNVNVNPLEGLSIKDVVILIRNYVMERLGDYSILLKALSQKGLTLKNLEDYNHLKFTTVDVTSYDCNLDGFPKITTSTLPDSITSVTYNLNINQIQPFIKSE